MKIIDNIIDARAQEKPLSKLEAMQEANKAKGKRTHPVGTYMLFGAIGLVILAGSLTREAKAPPSPCSTDWTKCSDVRSLMNSKNPAVSSAQFRCQTAADKTAKYGTPKWPRGWPFTSFGTTRSNLSTGLLVLAEDEAQFSNGFGAMVHVQVICDYDLKTAKVLNVEILH